MLYRVLNPKLQATYYLTIFGHYLVQHYLTTLDGRRFLYAILRKICRYSRMCMFPL